MQSGSTVDLRFEKIDEVLKLKKLFETNSFFYAVTSFYIEPDMLISHKIKNTTAPMPAMVDNIQKNPVTQPNIPNTIARPNRINHSLRYL